MEAPKGGAPKGEGPEISRFVFPSHTSIFILFFKTPPIFHEKREERMKIVAGE